MNAFTQEGPNVWICNFSHINITGDHLLNFESTDLQATVATIRKHTDRPHVYVVGKEKTKQVAEVLAELKAIRSPSYPYALFTMDGAEVDADAAELDIVEVKHTDPGEIRRLIEEYAASKFRFARNKLQAASQHPIPKTVDVVVVGAGITGIYAAHRLKAAGISACVLEKRDQVGGIWSMYANQTSQVNTSESAYRLIEKPTRSNRDHSSAYEILEDIAQLSESLSDQIFLQTEVMGIEKNASGYRVSLRQQGEESILESRGVVLAINDRVGAPREIEWKHQAQFKGEVVNGISDGARRVDWRGKHVLIVGMGAFAVENTRTALEAGAEHVTVLARRHGTVCPKIIDYLNFATPYDAAFKHDRKSNLKNMMYWKKLYDLSGATQPECWMNKVKHDGHTISVSDIWFIGHYLKKIDTVVGDIRHLTETGVVVDGRPEIQADIIVNCIGFERNISTAKMLSGKTEMYNNNYLDKDFFYLADAYIDSDAFNSLFGSSVLEMVKFYMEVYIRFFDNPEYETMMMLKGIEKIPIEDRKWSHYIQGAMTLIENDPAIRETAGEQVAQRTKNFLEVHDLETYIRANKREWLDTHAMLAGKPMTEKDCLPYVFDRLLPA